MLENPVSPCNAGAAQFDKQDQNLSMRGQFDMAKSCPKIGQRVYLLSATFDLSKEL